MAKNIILTDKLLKIMFWNARSARSKFEEIKTKKNEFDIIICVESWLVNDETLTIPGFTTFTRNRPDSTINTRGGGIIIFVKNSLQFAELSNINSPSSKVEMCGLKLTNVRPCIEFIICYRVPESGLTLTQNQWDCIIQNVKSNNSIFIGDFNSHNTNWNCEKNDSNGLRLEESIDKSDLILHNDNSLTHLDIKTNKKSNIDLIFSTIDLAHKLNFEVCDELWGSDHFPIFINIGIEKEQYAKMSFKIKSVRTDWSKFQENLESTYNEFLTLDYTNLSASQKYEFFVKCITNAVKTSTPVRRIINSKGKILNPAAWWDQDCDKVKRLRRAAYKKWQFTCSLSDRTEYKRCVALAKRTFKNKRKDYVRKFVSSLDMRVDTSYVWRKSKVLKNSFIKVKPSSNYVTKDKVDEALDKLAPPWVQTNPDSIPGIHKKNEFFDVPFSYSELNFALDNKKTCSSPGMDGIDFDILKKLSPKFKLLLLDIFNEMHSSSIFPHSWKNTFVHFIPKPNGTSVRPIALTSCLCKLYETLLKNRLEWWIEHQNLLPNSQNGFRKGKSATDSTVNLALKVEEAFAEKKSVIAAFLDVEGAFDNVNIDILLRKLLDFGCSKSVLKFVKFILHERFIYTGFHGNECRSVFKGTT